MKTVTGLFDDYDDAADAVGELEAMGIPNSGHQHRRQQCNGLVRR